jgi:hypothetical protein
VPKFADFPLLYEALVDTSLLRSSEGTTFEHDFLVETAGQRNFQYVQKKLSKMEANRQYNRKYRLRAEFKRRKYQNKKETRERERNQISKFEKDNKVGYKSSTEHTCKCKGGCKNRHCGCVKADERCGPACSCGESCNNRQEEVEAEEPLEEIIIPSTDGATSSSAPVPPSTQPKGIKAMPLLPPPPSSKASAPPSKIAVSQSKTPKKKKKTPPTLVPDVEGTLNNNPHTLTIHKT